MWPFKKKIKILKSEERLPRIIDIKTTGVSNRISVELSVDGAMKVVDGTEEDFCEKIQRMDFSKTSGSDIYVIWDIYRIILGRVNDRKETDKGIILASEKMAAAAGMKNLKKDLTDDST